MNNKLFLFFTLLLMLVGFGFSEEVVDYSDGFEIEVFGSGVSFNQSGDGKFVFEEDGSELIVGENRFENIEKKVKDKESFVEIDSFGNVKSADFFVGEGGGVYVINNISFSAPAGSNVKFLDGKIFLDVEDGAVLEDFSFLDESSGSLELTGKDVVLPNGFVLQDGSLIYDYEGFSLKGGEDSRINDISFRFRDDISVVFDEERKVGKYVFFGENDLDINGDGLVSFYEGNDYVEIQDSDNFRVNLRDAKMSLKNKDELGLIPSLDVFGKAYVSQDSKIINTDGRNIFLEKFGYGTTTPMEVSFFDLDENPVFGIKEDDFAGVSTGSEHKILVDNFNRFAIIPEGAGEEFLAESEGVDVNWSRRISYHYVTRDDLNVLTGGKLTYKSTLYNDGIRSSGLLEGQESVLLGKTRDYWNTLTLETKNSVDNIYLLGSDEYNRLDGSKDTLALFSPMDSGAYFNYDFFDLRTFRHELTHARHESLIEEQVELQKGLLKDYKKLIADKNKVNSDIRKLSRVIRTSSDDVEKESASLELSEKKEYLAILDKRIDDEWSSLEDFAENRILFIEKEWGEIDDFEYIGNSWRKLDYKDFPRDGFFEPYAMDSWEEHLAVTSEYINQPKVFAELINPESEKFDVRYRKQLDFFHKHKFISDFEYNRILEIAGV